jgi:hypothetical protein
MQYALASNSCPAFTSLQIVNTGTTDQLGVPYIFSFLPDNPCGVTTNLGSYIWLRFELDDSQTATFPDVNGNHTAITNFTTYYNPCTTNRLRGGATFENGVLMSLDTLPSNGQQQTFPAPVFTSVNPSSDYYTDAIKLYYSTLNGDTINYFIFGTSGQLSFTTGSGYDQVNAPLPPNPSQQSTVAVYANVTNGSMSATIPIGNFTYLAETVPQISSVTNLGNGSVQVNGSMYQDVSQADINSGSVSFSVSSNTQMTVQVPSSDLNSTIHLTLYNPLGWSSTYNYAYGAAPSISSVTDLGNGWIQVNGSNFLNSSQADINSSSVSFSVSSNTQMTVQVPSSSITHSTQLTVYNALGWSNTYTWTYGQMTDITGHINDPCITNLYGDPWDPMTPGYYPVWTQGNAGAGCGNSLEFEASSGSGTSVYQDVNYGETGGDVYEFTASVNTGNGSDTLALWECSSAGNCQYNGSGGLTSTSYSTVAAYVAGVSGESWFRLQLYVPLNYVNYFTNAHLYQWSP